MSESASGIVSEDVCTFLSDKDVKTAQGVQNVGSSCVATKDSHDGLSDLSESIHTREAKCFDSKESTDVSNTEYENVGIKAHCSVQEEDGGIGFIVIKPEIEAGSHSQEEESKREENSAPNIFIIQNPHEMTLNGFDADVISQVHKALVDSGSDNSIMIVNDAEECNDDSQDATTYIIDLNGVNEDEVSSSLLPSSTENPICIQQQKTFISSSQSSTVSSSASTFKPLVSAFQQSASKISNKLVSESNIDKQNFTYSDINTATDSFSEKSIYNISSSTNYSTDLEDLPKNLNTPSQFESTSQIPSESPVVLASSNIASTSISSVTTSQVAEQLMHIAKKMIEDSSHRSQTISVDESQGKIVISSPESQKSGDRSSSESVITMYVSSPDDLKMKLKKLKTNSPVIVMQAGEDPSTSDENKENPPCNSSSESIKVDIEKVSKIRQLESSSQHSDGLAAALSSLTGGVLYRCSECGYSSHNKHYYKQHVDLVHNEERPYKCPHCDYAGKRRHALLEHMVVHSNQRPYSCNHCNASFRKKGHLTNHVKLHMSHRLVHCGVCNIQLPDAEAFESHLRKIHNTDKLYKCKLCEHTVVDRRAMLTHLATHNESIVFSCPNCPSYFNQETSLLDHMKDVHNIVRKALKSEKEQNIDIVDKNKQTATYTKPSRAMGSDKNVQSANIVCSECGYMCTDTQVMKKHMWVHINPSSESGVQLKDQASSKKTSISSAPSSAMGVLKMNVVSGMKSLPENIVYQCTSCKFTSSDNSVFIKHMLLHKTQRKQQDSINKVTSQPNHEPMSSLQLSKPVSSAASNLSSTLTSSSSSDSTPKERRTDSSVPFVFDQVSGRYRCLICGYHCDFQRTIKAHIWKHSGNQNIEYPVFEQVAKSEPSSTTNVDLQGKLMSTIDNQAVTTSVTTIQTSQPRSFNSSPGRNIKTLPFIPSNTRVNSQGSQDLNDCNTDIICTDRKPNLELMENITTVSSSGKTRDVEPSDKPSTLVIENKIGGEVEQEKIEPQPSSETGVFSSLQDNDPSIIKHVASNDGCTEPSVVVEIVDSVPPSLGLTGMKSQQGSPRVSDLEGSGNDFKLTKMFKDMANSKAQPQDEKVNILKSETEEESSLKSHYDLRKPKDVSKVEIPANKLKRFAAKEVKSGTLSAEDPKEKLSSCSPEKQLKIDVKEVLKGITEPAEVFSNDESDDTASSDEIVSAGESGNISNPPKAGICSSLLAVIEQLRERSRSECERDQLPVKELPKRSHKRNKKLNWTPEAESLSEFHNIEKIDDGGGEKFRCSLCHYTSQRICNMKIHMKTHRQKKPSECSLCDFASASSELLQEHMLQHCKVRTYACKFCPQSFNHKSTLRAHLRAHKDHDPFLCAYCVFETTNPNEYREHMHVHSGCSSRLRCPGCDYIMNSKDELTPHLMKCKGQPPVVSAPADSSISTRPSDSSTSPKAKDGGNDAKATQATPAPSTQPTQHSCVVSGCSFSSYSLKELQDHLSVHCNPSLMMCDLCDFKALHSRSLKSHMKRHANDQRYVSQPLEQYKCNLCGYVCHHLPSLKSHMWRHASDQSYSYEFTNDVINAAIDHDSRVDVNKSQPDDPDLLVQFINSESRIMEGELTNFGKGDGQRPTCWVTFRCCSCGFETINKAKLNIHMRSHSDLIQQTLDIAPRKPGVDKSNHQAKSEIAQPLTPKNGNRRSPSTEENNEPFVPPKIKKAM